MLTHMMLEMMLFMLPMLPMMHAYDAAYDACL